MTRSHKPALAAGAVVASFLAACGSGGAPPPGAPEAVVETQAALQPASAASSFCGHVRGGLPSSKAPLLALSEAHAAVRYFGANDSFTSADQALAKALARPFTPRRDVLDTYVAALGNGQSCVAETSNDDLGQARVHMEGDVAIVRPGTGSISLPPEAKAVAIDVRGLPDVPGLRDALDAAAALALASPVARPMPTLRAMYGNPDALFGDPNYFTFLEPKPEPDIPGGAAADLPLAVLTEDAMAPAAAELAATLRLAGRAWLFGADAWAAVAESSFSPVAEEGIAWRREDLADATSGARWPDVIPADAGGDPLGAVRDLSTRGAPPPAVWGPATRPLLMALDPSQDNPPADLGPGEARADLVTIHGALRSCFLYFDVVGDHIDERLAETLAEVDLASAGGGALDRANYVKILMRMAEVIHDGHAQGYDILDTSIHNIPTDTIHVGDSVLVRQSITPGVLPGDAIVSIDGVPTGLWLADWERFVSAATPGYAFESVRVHWLNRDPLPRTFGLLRADGSFADVVAIPGTVGGGNALYHDRPSGFLSDLGAPDVYLLQMSEYVVSDTNAVLASIGEASGARAMVVDMRKYPLVDHYPVAQALIPTTFQTPGFWVALRESPWDVSIADYGGPIPPADGPPTFAGPITLMVSNRTISAAENFSTMLVDAQRLAHVVGQQSAGTNGDVTGIHLPGQFGFIFTGMKVTHADGSRFHGIGIVPDIVVTPTQADYAAGRDPELLAAIQSLR